MPKVTVCARVSQEHFHALQEEAARRGVKVEALVEQTVNALIQELEDESEFGEDTAIGGVS